MMILVYKGVGVLIVDTLQTITNGLNSFLGTDYDITYFTNQLNPKILSPDSIQGLITLLLIIYIVSRFVNKLFDAFRWSLGLILLMQIGHIISEAGLKNMVPFMGQLFKYDVLQSIAQLCVGTKLCEWILYLHWFLSATYTKAFAVVMMLWNLCVKYNVWNFIIKTLRFGS